MSRLDELPPDQRAALSLLLRQRKSYAEVALMLGIAERAVHDRAQAALAVLAPREARQLSPEQREDLGDYLLAQQPGVAERLRTRVMLDGSEPARAWARSVAAELAALGEVELPAIPAGSPAQSEPPRPGGEAPATVGAGASSEPPQRSDTLPSSRLGGALLLGAIVVAIVVAVILLTGGGSSHGKPASPGSSTTSTSSTKKAGPTVTQRITLTSPNGQSRSFGVVEVLAEAGKFAFFIDAEHLPPSTGFFYAIWLYSSPTSAQALSRSPAVGSNGKLAGGALLPSNASEYREIILTRETNPHPTHPGEIVLRGAFSLGG